MSCITQSASALLVLHKREQLESSSSESTSQWTWAVGSLTGSAEAEPGRRRLRGYLSDVHHSLHQGKPGSRVSLEVQRDSTGGNRLRMGHREFQLLIREAFCPTRVVKCWNKPGDTQNSGNKVLNNLIYTGCAVGLGWDGWVFWDRTLPDPLPTPMCDPWLNQSLQNT